MRQLECCLYWQGTARKQLRQEITEFRKHHPAFKAYKVVERPEAMGLNVTATMASIGHELEWPPHHWVYKVAFAGWPVQGEQNG